MCIPKLCPFCDSNVGCQPAIPIKVVTDSAQTNDAHESGLITIISAASTKKSVCAVVDGSLDRALETGAKSLSVAFAEDASFEQARMIASVVKCRVILKLSHEVQTPFALSEIRLLCKTSQAEAVAKGLASQHPLCVGCYEA